MTVAEIKARNMIKEKSTEQLLDLWMMISNTVSVDAAMVRGRPPGKEGKNETRIYDRRTG